MAATKAEIYEQVIEPLKTGYIPRHHPDKDPRQHGELVDMMVESILENRFTAAALKYGMKVFRQDWTYARWPVFGELKPFLATGERMDSPAVKVEHKPMNRDKWADHVMRTPNGQTAIANGLALSLYEWAEEHPGQEPRSEDMAGIIEGTRRQNANMEYLRGSSNSVDRELLKIGEGIERKRIRVEYYYGKPKAIA